MSHPLFTKAPLIAVVGAVFVFVIVAGAGVGFEWPVLLAVATTLFAAGEGWALWFTVRQKLQGEKHLRHIRFIADRFQGMVRCAPCGYCLFTPQGLLREEMGSCERLGVEKIGHMDDLIGAVKEGAELLEVFRRLQMTGDPFDIEVHRLSDLRGVPVLGRRFRVGRDGPHVDVLWFCDIPAIAASVSVAEKKKEEPALRALAPEEPKVEKPQKEIKQAAAAASAPAPVLPPVKIPDAPSGPVSLQAAADLLDLPVWGRAKDLSLVFCNAAYARGLDLAPEKVLKDQAEIVPASPKGGSGRALAAEALEKNERCSQRLHAVIGGQRRLLALTERPVEAPPAGGPEALALIGFAVDVTGEEEKETELRRHLVAHHEVMEHLGAAISIFGADQRLEFYNRAYLRLWEGQEAFLDGKPSFSEILEDLRVRRRIPDQVDFQKYKKERLALFTSLLEPREDVMYLPDGTSLRILAAPHPMGGLMFVHENVTDRLALETSYNTLMAVQHETIENLAEGIAVFGADGRLRLSNAALGKLWSLPADLLASEPHVADILEAARDLLEREGEDWATRKAEMVTYALDRTSHAGRMERKDGMIVEYVTVPLPDGSVLNSFLDVTAAVRVEQALRDSNDALAAADRLKSDFVANVSYQLRTPLNTITGFAEILTEQYFGKLNERQMEYTLTIKAESEKLARLINDVLDLATIEAGRMTLERETVGVAALLNEAKQMTAEWARQQSLDILIECPPDIGAFDVDEQRMKQVLFNLIGNAIKYTPPGGHIALAAWKQDPWIVVSVLDTGVGIPEEDKQRVFDKFEKSNKRLRQGGAGLGLSLVRSFVELHGGYVELLSDEKDGTRVSCFLPQKEPSKTPQPAKEG